MPFTIQQWDEEKLHVRVDDILKALHPHARTIGALPIENDDENLGVVILYQQIADQQFVRVPIVDLEGLDESQMINYLRKVFPCQALVKAGD